MDQVGADYASPDFRTQVYAKAASCSRDLPWRRTTDPYAILVSELMCQQTQVARARPKYLEWIERFPTARDVADADVSELLKLWSGLGYNRRALALASACRIIAYEWQGIIPDDESALKSLPGLGQYTARAVLVFAWNKPVALIETNIRTVYLKHFFPAADSVPEKALGELAERMLDREHSRKWHNALMDYGAEIKRVEGNHSRRAAAYQRQSPFSDSFRRVRGAVLKSLVRAGQIDLESLHATLPFSRENLERAVELLVAEGFASRSGAKIFLGSAKPS